MQERGYGRIRQGLGSALRTFVAFGTPTVTAGGPQEDGPQGGLRCLATGAH